MDVQKKRALANKKRLESVKNKCKDFTNSQRIIQASLKNINITSKRHIVFDDDDDDNDDDNLNKKLKVQDLLNDAENDSGKNQQSTKEENTEMSDSGQLKKSDPLNIDNDDEELSLSAYLNKTSGDKLFNLQKQLGNDERFKIDERFMSSDSESVSDGNMSDNDDRKSDDNIAKEVKSNLAVLQQVLGPLNVATVGKTDVHFSDPSTKRYDPLVEIQNEQKSEKPKKQHTVASETTSNAKKQNKKTVLEKKDKRAAKVVAPKVSKKQFYDVKSGDLKQLYDQSKDKVCDEKGISKPFSLLSMLGRDEDEEDDIVEDTHSYKVEDISKLSQVKTNLQNTNVFEYDTSDTDTSDHDDDEITQTPTTNVPNVSPAPKEKTAFLFFRNDPRLRDVPKKFCDPDHLKEFVDNFDKTKSFLTAQLNRWHKSARYLQKHQPDLEDVDSSTE